MLGRPTKSKIRQNILKILNHLEKAHGYEIYNYYIKIFGKVHIRSIYYNLKKGVELNEIEIKEVKTEPGDYSWGGNAERIYYTLGPKAAARESKKVKEFFLK